jgi:hypothetical protein
MIFPLRFHFTQRTRPALPESDIRHDSYLAVYYLTACLGYSGPEIPTESSLILKQRYSYYTLKVSSVTWCCLFVYVTWFSSQDQFLCVDDDDDDDDTVKRGSSHSVVTTRFNSRQGQVFSVCHSVQTGSRADSASQPQSLIDTRVSFPGVKRAGNYSYRSPQSSAEIKKAWSCTSTPSYVFVAWRGV